CRALVDRRRRGVGAAGALLWARCPTSSCSSVVRNSTNEDWCSTAWRLRRSSVSRMPFILQVPPSRNLESSCRSVLSEVHYLERRGARNFRELLCKAAETLVVFTAAARIVHL